MTLLKNKLSHSLMSKDSWKNQIYVCFLSLMSSRVQYWKTIIRDWSVFLLFFFRFSLLRWKLFIHDWYDFFVHSSSNMNEFIEKMTFFRRIWYYDKEEKRLISKFIQNIKYSSLSNLENSWGLMLTRNLSKQCLKELFINKKMLFFDSTRRINMNLSLDSFGRLSSI